MPASHCGLRGRTVGHGYRRGWRLCPLGTPEQERLSQVTPEDLAGYQFPAGSMGPKVEAAARFAAKTGRRAAIGSLEDIAGIVAGTAGTNVVSRAAPGPGAGPEKR
jgi:carbamate kinase